MVNTKRKAWTGTRTPLLCERGRPAYDISRAMRQKVAGVLRAMRTLVPQGGAEVARQCFKNDNASFGLSDHHASCSDLALVRLSPWHETCRRIMSLSAPPAFEMARTAAVGVSKTETSMTSFSCLQRVEGHADFPRVPCHGTFGGSHFGRTTEVFGRMDLSALLASAQKARLSELRDREPRRYSARRNSCGPLPQDRRGSCGISRVFIGTSCQATPCLRNTKRHATRPWRCR